MQLLLLGAVVIAAALLLYLKPWDDVLRKSRPYPALPNRFWVEGIIGTLYRIFTAPPPGFFFPGFLLKTFEDLGRPDVYSLPIFIGSRRMWVLNTPALVQQLLSDRFKQGDFNKGPFFIELFKDFLGAGIFTSNGERWKAHREFAAPLFHADKLKTYAAIFNEEAVSLGDLIERRLSPGGLDMQSLFFRYTVETFGQIGFGVKLGSFDKDEEASQFQRSFDVVQQVTNDAGRWPPLHALYKWAHPTFWKDVAYMDTFVQNIIDARRAKATKAELENSADLVSRLLLLEKEKELTAQDFRDWVMNFLIAGRDTTAVLLTFATWELARNPEVQEQLYEEVMAVCPEGEVTWAQQGELRYTKRVLQETLRLWPPLPVEGFDAASDLMLDGIFIQAECPVFYSAYVMGRDPQVWGDDCLAFKPQRFETPPRPFTLNAFHGGPRLCLGQDMAYLEAKIALAHLIRRFEFRALPSFTPLLKSGILMSSANGMLIDMKPRGS